LGFVVLLNAQSLPHMQSPEALFKLGYLVVEQCGFPIEAQGAKVFDEG
jgi:hypothetical protein